MGQVEQNAKEGNTIWPPEHDTGVKKCCDIT
jgi:hypothetical protein